jgi:hypothetical protein
MLSGKSGMVQFNLVRCFTHDFEVAHHCVLGFGVLQEGQLGHALHVLVDAINGLGDVGQVVNQPQNV